MIRMSGADLTIHLLERQGITCLSGIPGGFNLPLYDALAKNGRIRHVLARHEQGAGFIAHGMARSTGKPAVFFATSGPGATNTLTALADARLDSIPIICITGQVPGSMLGTDAFQEVDIYGMSLPVTKHNFLVRDPQELVHVIPEAFRIASSGRPGPVLVDIPKDVQTAMIELTELPEPGGVKDAPAPDPSAVQRAAEYLNSAQRPVLLLGGGTRHPRIADLVHTLVNNHRIPAAMSLQGLGTLPPDHAMSLGMLGMHGACCTNILLEEADLLLVLGARLDDRATGRIDAFCRQATVIHIDIDPGELEKLRAVHVGIIADAGAAIEALLPLLQKRDRDPWHARVAALKLSHGMPDYDAEGPCTPYGIIRCTASCLDSDAIIATDVGQHQMRVAQAYPLNSARQWLTSGGLGCMGFGLPAAIGASLANPDRTVVCFTGDGSLLMNIQEMATAAEEGVNVKIILCNNNGLGLVQQQQDLFFGGRLFASTYTAQVDFQSIAKGFGIPSINISASADPASDLAQALQCRGPYLIEVNMAAEDKVFPMVPPGAGNCDMIGHFRA